MKKLNKKGFTLVELLAVVVILLAISVIAVSSISAAIERNKESQDEAKIKVILSYAKLYYEEHRNTETDNCIELWRIKSAFDLTEEELTYSNKNEIKGIITHTSGKDFSFDNTKEEC